MYKDQKPKLDEMDAPKQPPIGMAFTTGNTNTDEDVAKIAETYQADDVDDAEQPEIDPSEPAPITLPEYMEIMQEIDEQPLWRHIADKEMDYADGNQLDGELLARQRALGIPPAVENLIGKTIQSVCGYEATVRTDWRVKPYNTDGNEDLADALNQILNMAERESKADRACSKAFNAAIACGIGWVEVAKESDPFKYEYRCTTIHRNEIHWDMASREFDLSDARWLRRVRWIDKESVKAKFPEAKGVIDSAFNHGRDYAEYILDGGISTGLNNAWDDARAWTTLEQEWYRSNDRRVAVTELWYRRYVTIPMIKSPDGRMVEFDDDNQMHIAAVATGKVQIEMVNVTKLRQSFWVGPHKLLDRPSPYPHRYFPYVRFIGFMEDQTGIPFGYVRDMKYSQDSLNSGLSKLRWSMSVTRVERTKGAVDMTDEQLRRQVARADADIILNQSHMAKPGAKFDVKRDVQLSDQHYQMLQDNRASIERVSNITQSFMGRGAATSGIQEQTRVEQSNQTLATVMDNFRASRTQMGDMLLSMIIESIGSNSQTITILGESLKDDKVVTLNEPTQDEFGNEYLNNDVTRTRLKVVLDDVPSTNSYKAQQLNAFSEVIKSMPPQYQAPLAPFMVALMDVPFRSDVIKAIKSVDEQQTPEQIQAQIDAAVKDALQKAGIDIKQRELDLKAQRTAAEIDKLKADTVQTGVAASFSAMQAGAQIAQMPMIAPIADKVMQGAGYENKTAIGDDPNFPMPQNAAIQQQAVAAPTVQENTSPNFPPLPDDGQTPMQGIETAEVTDNL